MIPENRITTDNRRMGLNTGWSSLGELVLNMELTSQPRKKAKNRTRAAGAWGIPSWMPKKYGRLLMSGKQKTKISIPAFFLMEVTIKMETRTGTKNIWKLFTRGTYFT